MNRQVKPKSTTIGIEKKTGTGPLSRENLLHVLVNVYWVARIASALELITQVDDIEKAHEIAREHLRVLTDPEDGLLEGIPDDMKLNWTIASRKGSS